MVSARIWLFMGGLPATWAGQVQAQTLSVDEATRVQGASISLPSYDYVPSVIWTGKYQMWWCRGVAGDYIVRSESADARGPWQPWVVSLAPTNRVTDFDGQHVCDPSIININGTWYMYYGAFPLDRSKLPKTTMVGVAKSKNGIQFTRGNGGRPIVRPHDLGVLANPGRRYGAGQPAALYLDGWVYLLYSDSTGRDSNPSNGGGVYVIRSRDPEFRGAVEELTRNGFAPRWNTSGLTTEFKLLDAYSVDWQFCDRIDAFLVAVNGLRDVSTIFTFDRSLRQLQRVDVPGVPWTEGPTIARRMDGHALPHAASPRTRVPLILFYSIGDPANPFSFDIGFTGLDLLIR